MAAERTDIILQELVRRANEEGRRLRALEQRLQAVETRLDTIEDLNLKNKREIGAKFSQVSASIKSINDEIIKLKNNLDKINKQITRLARKADVKELEKMFELLNPIRQQFVTRKELEELINSKKNYK